MLKHRYLIFHICMNLFLSVRTCITVKTSKSIDILSVENIVAMNNLLTES